jgi:uncharacterized protein DUF4372
VNKVSSIFSQILKFVPRLKFEAAVKKHNAEHHARGFRCWDQFVAMMFCQLGHAQSLREITGGLAACEGKVKQLGMDGAPGRSTLASPTGTAPGNSTRACSGRCSAAASKRPGGKNGSSASSTSYCPSTAP